MVLRWCWLALLAAAFAHAQPFTVSDAETRQPPTRARVEGLLSAAQRDGWAPQIAALRSAAMASYRQGNVFTADAWFQLYGWASLLGEDESRFSVRWLNTVTMAGVGHPGMAQGYTPRSGPLSLRLSPELQAWMIGDPAFSSDFFALLSPMDYLPRTFEILDALYRSGPDRFKAYPSLALAIAVVFDVAPPPSWPHWQVSPEALPRRHPDPVKAFQWWVQQDQQGRTQHNLKRLHSIPRRFTA
jgi:hypothetical protein